MMIISLLNGARLRLATKAVACCRPWPRSCRSCGRAPSRSISVSGDALRALHHLEQLHDVGRREEMRAGDILRPLRHVRHDRPCRSPEVLENSNAPGFMTSSSFSKTSFLTAIRSNTASITTSQSPMSSIARRPAGCGRAAAPSRPPLRLPRLTLRCVIGADARHAAVERFLGRVHDLHVEAEIGEATWRCRRPSCRRRRPPGR